MLRLLPSSEFDDCRLTESQTNFAFARGRESHEEVVVYFVVDYSKKTAENQYASLRSAIGTVVQRQGWKVNQVSFITGARSVDKQDFQKNLKFFGVPEASISSIYSKLAIRTFDVYANILKCMYSTRFNGGAAGSEDSIDAQPTPCVDAALTHPINTLPHPDKHKRRKKESPKERDK